MKKEDLENLVLEGLSIKDISEKTGKSKTTVRYWLKKLNLKTKRAASKESENKYCPRCKETKNREQFYQRRGKEGGSVYCKKCTSEQTIERMRDFKQKCVEYKGGKCIICEYNKCNDALEFHHVNAENKDFTISHLKSYTFDGRVKKELDKCVLVCNRCHREIHAKLIQLD